MPRAPARRTVGGMLPAPHIIQALTDAYAEERRGAAVRTRRAAPPRSRRLPRRAI
jgi:hypothetical protein